MNRVKFDDTLVMPNLIQGPKTSQIPVRNLRKTQRDTVHCARKLLQSTVRSALWVIMPLSKSKMAESRVVSNFLNL